MFRVKIPIIVYYPLIEHETLKPFCLASLKQLNYFLLFLKKNKYKLSTAAFSNRVKELGSKKTNNQSKRILKKKNKMSLPASVEEK